MITIWHKVLRYIIMWGGTMAKKTKTGCGREAAGGRQAGNPERSFEQRGAEQAEAAVGGIKSRAAEVKGSGGSTQSRAKTPR